MKLFLCNIRLSKGSIYPSVGGCDEEIVLFALEKNLDENQLNEMMSKIHGDSEHE